MSEAKLRAVPEKRHTLNVPCIGWIYSQSPDFDEVENPEDREDELKTPIIIWWMEPMLPAKVKRKLYFSYLDEIGAPLRGNLSQAIQQKNAEYKHRGWNINCTNTYRYVYAVPKINDRSGGPGTRQHFAGYNLWANYRKTSYTPSYIADRARLAEQGLLSPDVAALPEGTPTGNILADSKDSRDEQVLYRNMVIRTCQPLINPEGPAELTDPTCSTTAVEEKLENNELKTIARYLFWNLDVFLQYVADNTFRNFQRAGYGHRLLQEAIGELRLVEYLLFQEKNYRLSADGTLVTPPTVPGVETSRYDILGLRLPTFSFPWTY